MPQLYPRLCGKSRGRGTPGARLRITGLIGAYGGDPMAVTSPNGDQVGYVTVADECELLSDPAPDMD